MSQTGDPHSGAFSLTKAGTDRYDLLEAFKDVSNTQNGQTPGHMNFYSFGQAFVDPGPDRTREDELRAAARRNNVPDAYVGRLLRVIHDTPVPWGINPCDRWANQLLINLAAAGDGLETRGSNNGVTGFLPITYNDPRGGVTMEHVVIRVTFADGTVFCLDHGLLGGDTHIFSGGDIPSHWRRERGWGLCGEVGDTLGRNPSLMYVP
jgi:hypothetical protein